MYGSLVGFVLIHSDFYFLFIPSKRIKHKSKFTKVLLSPPANVPFFIDAQKNEILLFASNTKVSGFLNVSPEKKMN